MSNFIYTERPGDALNRPTILMLHGYGSHENDLFSFANDLPADFPIVSLRAPHPLPFGGFCWYQINFEASNPEERSDDTAAANSRDGIIAFIESYRRKQQTTQPLILMGFSQGCILSYAVAFTRPDLIHSVMALSGYLHTPILPDTMMQEKLRHLHFYVAHGTEDPILPVDWARKSVAFLEKNQLSHEYREYPIGHGIDPQGFQDLKKYLAGI